MTDAIGERQGSSGGPHEPLSGSAPNARPPVPLEEVVFHEWETVKAFGTSTIRYRVLVNRVWVAPQQLANSCSRLLEKSPSVLWHREVRVPLAQGVEVEKLVTIPERGNADAAAVLFGRSPGLRQRTIRTCLCVGPRGTLIPK